MWELGKKKFPPNLDVFFAESILEVPKGGAHDVFL